MQNIIPNISEKTSILQFLPKKFEYLTKNSKVEFEISYKPKNNTGIAKKIVNLKTAYLIDLMHKLIFRYYRHIDSKDSNSKNKAKNVNLCARILRECLYGTHYNYYIQYLIHIGFLKHTGNYLAGSFSNRYEIVLSYIKSKNQIVRYYNEDKFILRKWKNSYYLNEHDKLTSDDIDKSKSQHISSPIKIKLAQDLQYVKINIEESLKYLNDLYKNELITLDGFLKNTISIEKIHDHNFFFSEDKYGRLHTNMTNLKKSIRKKFITIEDFQVEEIDITNSQPKFLLLILKENNFDKTEPIEYKKYRDIVLSGNFYEELMKYCNNDREASKKLVYKVFFGNNNIQSNENTIFKNIFPILWEWLVKYKKENGDHRILSWELQKKEANLIFEKICTKIKAQLPEIKLFTVHDSIYYPKQYKEMVEQIFNKEMEIVFSNL